MDSSTSLVKKQRRIIIEYLLKGATQEERSSYVLYNKGDKKSIDWIDKVSDNRDNLIDKQITCNHCERILHIRETGICHCSANHKSYDNVVEHIINENNHYGDNDEFVKSLFDDYRNSILSYG